MPTMLPKALTWVLRSPLRFALVSVSAACMALGLFLATGGSGSGQATAAPRDDATTPRSSLPSRNPEPQGKETARPRDVAAARRVLLRFLDDYLSGDRSGSAHVRADLRTETTQTLWRGLRLTDPADFPRGPAQWIHRRLGGAFAAEYEISLPGPHRIVVDLVLTNSGWRVCDIESRGSR